MGFDSFWFGVIVGVAGVWLYRQWQAKQAVSR